MSAEHRPIIVGDVNLSELTDDELYEELTSMGVHFGPIVASTRRVYEKKLAVLLGGTVEGSPYQEEVDLEEDSAELSYINQSGHQSHGSYNIRHSPSNNPGVRQRKLDSDDLSFDHDLHTPSPRPSIRTVSSLSRSTYSSTSYVTPEKRVHTESPKAEGRGVVHLLLKLFFFLALVGALYFMYTYYYTESPFKGLEEMAKKTLEAFEAEEKKIPSEKATGSPK